jgi:hypothetical protein
MIDQARTMARLGKDPGDVLERARTLLIDSDALFFLVDVEDAIEELGLEIDGEGGSR